MTHSRALITPPLELHINEPPTSRLLPSPDPQGDNAEMALVLLVLQSESMLLPRLLVTTY